MSAFMCNDDLFQAIANRLPWDFSNAQGYTLVDAITSNGKVIRPATDRFDAANLMIKDWIQANCNGVNGRYPHHEPELPFPIEVGIMAKAIDLIPLWRAIKCLRYQCNSDVPASQQEFQDKIIAEMDAALELISDAIIEATDECKALKWGEVPEAVSVL